MTIKVELLPAFLWICDCCGADNFERAIAPEMSPEELADVKESLGVGEIEDGFLLASPDSVTCKSCGAVYETSEYGSD